MAKPNHQFEKRRRELVKKKKKEEKLRRKHGRTSDATEDGTSSQSDGAAPSESSE